MVSKWSNEEDSRQVVSDLHSKTLALYCMGVNYTRYKSDLNWDGGWDFQFGRSSSWCQMKKKEDEDEEEKSYRRLCSAKAEPRIEI